MKNFKRFRLLRENETIREQNAEIRLSPKDYIYPYFIVDGTDIKREISSMKGVYHLSIDRLLEDIAEIRSLGIDKVLLFGVIAPELKDARGSECVNPNNIVCRAVRAIKSTYPDIVVFTDICMCEYTSHGHCGLLIDQDVDNDSTLALLAQQSLNHALSGADFVAPSAMMDGQVAAIKEIFEQHNLPTKILSYSAKYASNYYGPFRDAAHSAPSFGNRKTYQMDYRTLHQGIEEIESDLEEGADWTMVKPAMAYLDMICRGKERFPSTVMVSYQVSGEYSMLKLAAEAGYADERNIFRESLTAIKRAGADYIITYYAKEAARNF